MSGSGVEQCSLNSKERVERGRTKRGLASDHSLFRGFCSSNNTIWIDTYRSANRNELRDIKTALAQLEFGHECLALTDPLPQVGLRNARVFPSLHKQFDNSQVKVGSE